MVASKPIKVPAKWQKLFKLLPGYDPIATAAPGEWFDVKEAEKAIAFFHECLKHIEGTFAGQPFDLRDWQQAVIGCLFGWKRADGTRRYREMFMGVPRGNGKTPLSAGICNYCLFCDDEPGAQVYSAAADVPQAALLYRHAVGMIRQEPELESRCEIRDSLRCISLKSDEASVYKVVSSDAPGKHGLNPHLVIGDELHAWFGRDLMEAFESAFAKKGRRQPLQIHITTRDFDRPSVCNEKWEYAEQVRAGNVKDSAFLPVLFQAEQDDDWTDEKTWEKANPNIDVSVDRVSLRRMCEKAKSNPALENTFKRLHLNMKTEQDMRVIPMASWDMGEETFTTEDLRGMKCFGGLDLASTEDLCSFGLVFPMEDDECRVLSWSWCPEEKIKRRAEKRFPYPSWQKDGWLTATTGNQTDYRVIREDICKLRNEYGFDILEISFDGWNAAQIVQDLMEHDGFAMVKTPQSLSQLSAPTKEFLRRVKAGKLKHQANPLLRWAASNLAVHYSGKVQENADLEDILDKVPVMPSKQSSADKIDPITAIVLGFKSMIAHPDEWGTSNYEKSGIVFV